MPARRQTIQTRRTRPTPRITDPLDFSLDNDFFTPTTRQNDVPTVAPRPIPTPQPTPTEPELVDVTSQEEAEAIEQEISSHLACNSCHTLFAISDLTETHNQTHFCSNCLDDSTFRCGDCDNIYDSSIDDYTGISDNTICYSCREENYSTCESCGDYFYNDNIHECNDCGDYFCDNHASDHGCEEDETEEERTDRLRRQEENNPYREVSTVFTKGKVKGQVITIDRFVGVEIEGEKGKIEGLKKILPKTVGIAHDGSLSDHGVEIQTSPSSLDELEKIIKLTCEGLKSQGFKGTRNCGLHVHIDARDFLSDHKKIVQIIKTFYSCEDILYSMLPPSRWGNHYCQRLSQNYLYKNFNKSLSKKKIESEWYHEDNRGRMEERKKSKYDKARYYGLNIHSIFFRGTVELRYHSGTVEESKILSWIEIMLQMVDYALNRYNDRDIRKMFNMETDSDKFYYFCNIFSISYSLKDYVQKRTSKFNPNYRIKFNKGKKIRTEDRKQIAKMKKEIVKQTQLAIPKATKDVKSNPRVYSYMYDQPKELEKIIKKLALDYAFAKLSSAYKRLPLDGGFANDKELEDIVQYIQQGIRLHEDQSNTSFDTEE